MGPYRVVEGYCQHYLCVSRRLIDKPWMGRIMKFYHTAEEAQLFLEHSASSERRCPHCKKIIARKHFRIIERNGG